MSFERLFHPRGIAIIGASADLTRIGGHPIKALKNAGYKGGIFPINPKYPELHGLTCYPDVLASIGALRPRHRRRAGARRARRRSATAARPSIPFAVVLTAGFRETGRGGPQARGRAEARRRRERRAHRRAQLPGHAVDPVARVGRVRQRRRRDRFPPRQRVVRVPVRRLRLCRRQPRRGAGRWASATASPPATRPTSPCRELLSAFLDDPGTSLVFAYLEGTPDARRLLDVGRKSLETGKPVLIWKAATTDAGIKAAASHTANMTGSYDLYRAALRQSGLIEVDDVEPIVDIAKLFAQGRLPKGNAVGVLSISGGSGIVFADAAVRGGLTLPPFSRRDACRAAQDDPGVRLAENPADVTAGFFNDMTLFTRTLDIVLADPRPRPARRSCWPRSRAPARRTPARRSPPRRPRPTSRSASPGPAGRRSRAEAAEGADRGRRAVHRPRRCGSRAPPPSWPASPPTGAACCRARRPRCAMPKGLELPAGAVTLNEAESKARAARLRRAGRRARCSCPPAPMRQQAAKALKAPFAVKIVSRDIAAQDGSRRRQARRRARRAWPRPRAPSSTTRARQCRAPRSTACSSPRWRRASRR